MPKFNEELERDVIEFGQRINAREPEPIRPKQTLQTEIYQLGPENSRQFLALKDPQLGFQYLRDHSTSAGGN